jgi:lysophospholipase L1-like esterase
MRRRIPFIGLVAVGLLGCHRTPDYAIILAGNSIVANREEVPFDEYLAAALPPMLASAHLPGRAAVTANIANNGGTTSRMLARDSTGVVRAYEAAAARPAVLLVYEGSNDLWYLMGINTPNVGLQAYRNLKQFCTERKAQFPRLLTVTGTVLPRTDVPNQAVFEQERLVLNEQLRQAWRSQEPWLDGLADPARHPNMQHPSPTGVATTYYKDGVHPSTAGLEAITPLFAQAISTALAASRGGSH